MADLERLPTYIPLAEAAEKYRLGRGALTRLVESGRIRAVRINGGVAVAAEDVNIAAVQVQARASGDELVSINEAARRVGLHSRVVWGWYNNGWLEEMGRGPNRIVFVSLKQAQVLGELHAKRGRRGRRLIPRGMDLKDALLNL